MSNERAGVFVSSGIGGISTIESEHAKGMSRGFDKVSPYYIPMAIINLTAGNIAIDLNAHGSCQAMVTACFQLQLMPSVRHTATSSMGMLISCLPEAARLLSRNSR